MTPEQFWSCTMRKLMGLLDTHVKLNNPTQTPQEQAIRIDEM